jgi:hypothetical protein
MKTYQITIYGVLKGNITAISAHSAMIKASIAWMKGDTRGISVKELSN